MLYWNRIWLLQFWPRFRGHGRQSGYQLCRAHLLYAIRRPPVFKGCKCKKKSVQSEITLWSFQILTKIELQILGCVNITKSKESEPSWSVDMEMSFSGFPEHSDNVNLTLPLCVDAMISASPNPVPLHSTITRESSNFGHFIRRTMLVNTRAARISP